MINNFKNGFHYTITDMPASVKFSNHSAPSQAWIKKDNVLPVVIIKDPFTWFHESMCRNSYRVTRWAHSEGHCPNLVPATMKERKFVAKPYTYPESNFNSTVFHASKPNLNITHSIPVSVKFPLSFQKKQT